jgi:peptidoglycan/xylan/chitin deacetylase (PgdA/CDA1 family)
MDATAVDLGVQSVSAASGAGGRRRDLVGYGASQPRVVWPNGSRLAVSIVVNFEEGAELCVGDGDATNEPFGEVQSVVPRGVRDLPMEEIFAYGLRAGLPRMLHGLDRYRIPATFMMCGQAVARSPDAARGAIGRGHEPAVHGWRWIPHAGYDDPEKERADINRARTTIREVTGVDPVGFMCRSSQSAATRRLLIEEGFLYDSNGLDDDIPYWDRLSGARPILILPYAFDTNDMKFFHPNGFRTPEEYLGYLRRALEILLAEADRGETRLLTIGLHLRIVGRPARFWAVERLFEDLKGLGTRIWLARRRDIAEHWASVAPAAR